MEILKAVKDIAPDTVLLVLTAYATLEVGIEAVKLGAYDVLTKPFNNEHVVLTVRKALDAKRLTVENLLLKRELKGQASFENFVGTSEVMQKVFALIRRVAETSSTVLICGESGTGKERSEEHTSELQSLAYLVCRLLLEKKNKDARTIRFIISHSRSDLFNDRLVAIYAYA